MLSNNIDSFQFPSCFIAMTNLDKKKLLGKTATKLTYNLNIPELYEVYTEKKRKSLEWCDDKKMGFYLFLVGILFSFNSQIYIYIFYTSYSGVFPMGQGMDFSNKIGT